MYSFYYVATGLKDADFVFHSVLWEKGTCKSGSLRIMSNVANSVVTEL